MKRPVLVLVFVSLAGLVGACRTSTRAADPPAPPAAASLAPVGLSLVTPSSEPGPPPEPPRILKICQAEEPNTLFIYGDPSRAALNVLEAVYDGPIDTRAYQSQPVILEKLPSLYDGDASVRSVRVDEGDVVVDATGHTAILQSDTVVLDANGRETTLRRGRGVVTMTQMVVSFTLRADVTWADGMPVTADDSRFSYELAREVEDAPLRVRLLVDQTDTYEVVDELTVVWRSVPGYRDHLSFEGFHLQNHYYHNFFQPLPRHVWGTADAEHLLDAEVAHRYPLGWGAFVVREWVDGDHITLVRSPHYFRAAEGLPYVDQIDIRFVSSVAQALRELVAGDCDIIAQDVIELEAVGSGTLAPLLEAAAMGIVELVQASSTEWEHLDFSVQRSEWVEKPPFFEDQRTRQAVAMCVHRDRIAGEAVPYGEAEATDSYVSTDHPQYAGSKLAHYNYDPVAALALLEQIGWRDEDGDGVREAHDVPGIGNGTALSVTLLASSIDLARERAARILVENLAACGIRVGVTTLPADELFADGPDGPVFGRAFDLALFSWRNDLDAPCWLYLSSEIPSAANWWATSNSPGYASTDYDAFCLSALAAFPGTAAYLTYHEEAQRIFSYDVPVLPLYVVPKLVAVRPGVNGVVLDPTESLEYWAIEYFDVEGGRWR